MATLKWLHLADLQVGRSDTPITTREVRAELERDLRNLHHICGPWDVVFLTGSLIADRRNPTLGPTNIPQIERNFVFLDSVLDSLWGYLQSLGSNPVLLPLPGFGDLDVSTTPGSDAEQGLAAYVRWTQSWYARHPIPPWITLTWADPAASWRLTAIRDSSLLGIAGLGSQVFLPGPPTTTELPDLLETALGRPLGHWTAEHDVTLLVLPRPFRAKHTPMSAVHHLLHGVGAVISGQPATVPHERGFTTESLGLPTVLVPSMARLDGLGYTAGIVELPDHQAVHQAVLRLWPRELSPSSRGTPVFVPAANAHPETGEWVLPLPIWGEDDGLTAVGSPSMPIFDTGPDDISAFPIFKTLSRGTVLARPGDGEPAKTSRIPPSDDDGTPKPKATKSAQPGESGRPSLLSKPIVAPAVVPETFATPVQSQQSAPPPEGGVVPPGLTLVDSYPTDDIVVWVVISPTRAHIALLTAQTTVVVLETKTMAKTATIHLNDAILRDTAFSPDGTTLAVATSRGLHLVVGNEVQHILLTDMPNSVVWESPQVLLVGFTSGTVTRYDADGVDLENPLQPAPPSSHGVGVSAITHHPHRGVTAVGQSSFRSAVITRYRDGGLPTALTLSAAILDMAFSPDGSTLTVACDDGLVVVVDTERWTVQNTLRAHWDAVTSVAFSPNGHLLVTKGLDDRVLVWNTLDWVQRVELAEPVDRRVYSNAMFLDDTTLLTLRPNNRGLRFWTHEFGDAPPIVQPIAPAAVKSAKVVLLGEGRSGKSCLALRLAEKRYDSEIPSTHGMRIWRLDATVNADEPREIILWDLGGQHEYRLIHPLFLRHTSVALLVVEPGRGPVALKEISVWDQMLCSRSDLAQKPTRFLVGTKLDDLHAPIDQVEIDSFVTANSYYRFFPTSARTGFGCTELFQTILTTIGWSALGKNTRTAFENIAKKALETLREEGRVVVPLNEIERRLQQQHPDVFDVSAVSAVLAELALCGLVADTRLGDGTRVVVLDVEIVEKYAGALVVCARENPRGVPAIEIGLLSSPGFTLPRLRPEDRLSRDQELVILDVTVELILEQGLAFRTGGLLIFPSLFPSDDSVRPPERHTVPLYYEFGGAVDQVYATVVSSLANLRRFGAVRLYKNAAEFGLPDGRVYGLSRTDHHGRDSTLDRIDLHFSDTTRPDDRAVFIQFVEEHLREFGFSVVERLELQCGCGFLFDEALVRKRIEKKLSDMLCPECESRTPISFVAKGDGQREQIRAELVALRKEVSDSRNEAVRDTKYDLQAQRIGPVLSDQPQPIRILHLSDLHIFGTTNPAVFLQPLSTDLRDTTDGLGVETLDLLVISGDITNYGTAEEFQKAHELVQELIKQFGLSVERCLIVPGNHDLSWEPPVYDWVPARKVNTDKLPKGSYVKQGDGVLLRNDTAYAGRFKNFSEHFYHPLFQQPYPAVVSDQGMAVWYPQFKLQFLLFNTAAEIDEYHQTRSLVTQDALAKAFGVADQQLSRAKQQGEIGDKSAALRLAVFHHPITGNEKVEDDGFAEQLRKCDVRIVLHGHVHEERHDLIAYLDPKRKMHTAGAGSFGAGAKERPPSVPRLYNLLEVKDDRKTVRVYTRAMRKDTGAWGGHTIWPGPDPHTKRSWVDLGL